MFIFSSVGNLIYIEPYHYSVTRPFFSMEIRLLQNVCRITATQSNRRLSTFFLVENGVIKVCKGNSGGENAILKRVYIVLLKKSLEQKYCCCYFPFIRNFLFFSLEGGGGKRGVPDCEFREQFYIHQGIRDNLKQPSFNAYGLLYQSFVVKKGESLSLIMRNYNLMKIPFVCVMFVFDPFLVVFIKGTFSSCLI